MQVAASHASAFQQEQADKARRDRNRRALLLSLVLLSACATQYDGFEWSDKPHATLPARVHHVWHPKDLWELCRVPYGSYVAGCAIRDYTRGVCDIYVDGQWAIPHEMKHCMGYDHIAEAR